MKNRKQKTISLTALLIGFCSLSISTLAQAESSITVKLQESYTPIQLQKSCERAGGVYDGQTSSGGTYSCGNENGNVTCSGVNNSCVGTRYGNTNTGGTETGGAALTGSMITKAVTLQSLLRRR